MGKRQISTKENILYEVGASNMHSSIELIFAFIISLLISFGSTPLVKKLAIKINATDKPNHRKIHEKLMPRLGGLAIFFGVAGGYIYLKPYSSHMTQIIIGAIIILSVGILDDKFTLSPKIKFLGQSIAALIVTTSGLLISKITLPFIGTIYLDLWSYPVTILWILAITNAINLIDGLDGLAAGVSTIAITSILIMAINGYPVVVALSVILIGSTLGFLYHNFYPAKIFMGDTGALFLGYSIAIISMLGLFKNVALFSFVIPVIVLAVPIFDTIFAIVRRILNKQHIAVADKNHLHYCIVKLGYSHRATVLIIYAISISFGISAIVFSNATIWISILIIVGLSLIIQIAAEVIGLIGKNKTPLISFFKRIFTQNKHQEEN